MQPLGPWDSITRRPNETTRALEAVRHRAKLSLVDVGKALGLDPRTVRRWEVGETRPRARRWASLLAYYARHAPEATQQLATLVGRPMPAIAPPPIDPLRAERAIARAADALDVAPKQVRAVLRAVGRVAAEAELPLDALVRAAFQAEAASPNSPGERRG